MRSSQRSYPPVQAVHRLHDSASDGILREDVAVSLAASSTLPRRSSMLASLIAIVAGELRSSASHRRSRRRWRRACPRRWLAAAARLSTRLDPRLPPSRESCSSFRLLCCALEGKIPLPSANHKRRCAQSCVWHAAPSWRTSSSALARSGSAPRASGPIAADLVYPKTLA